MSGMQQMWGIVLLRFRRYVIDSLAAGDSLIDFAKGIGFELGIGK